MKHGIPTDSNPELIVPTAGDAWAILTYAAVVLVILGAVSLSLDYCLGYF